MKHTDAINGRLSRALAITERLVKRLSSVMQFSNSLVTRDSERDCSLRDRRSVSRHIVQLTTCRSCYIGVQHDSNGTLIPIIFHSSLQTRFPVPNATQFHSCFHQSIVPSVHENRATTIMCHYTVMYTTCTNCTLHGISPLTRRTLQSQKN